MKYEILKKIIGTNAKKYDQKKWDEYVEKEKMCFRVPPRLFIITLIAGIILFVLKLNTYGYISMTLAVFFGFRYAYKINGACKTSKK